MPKKIGINMRRLKKDLECQQSGTSSLIEAGRMARILEENEDLKKKVNALQKQVKSLQKKIKKQSN